MSVCRLFLPQAARIFDRKDKPGIALDFGVRISFERGFDYFLSDFARHKMRGVRTVDFSSL